MAVLLGSLTFGLNGQESPSETFEQRVDVSLLEVDVYVTDRDGAPVRGLGRDDFVLRASGKRINVTHFAEVQDGTPRPDSEDGKLPIPPRTQADRSNLVFFVDHAHLEPGELGDVIDALRGFLRRHTAPGDHVLVVEANHDLRIVQPLTPVPELALAALDALAAQAPRTHTVSEMTEIMSLIERKVQEGSDALARDRNLGPQELKTQIDAFTIRNHRELEQTTLQLHRLLPALAGLPGRRMLIYVGGTPPTNAGRALFDAWRGAFGPGSRYQLSRSASGSPGNELAALDSTGGAVTEADAGALFEVVADAANDHGVTLYSLDAGGLRSGRGFISGQDTPGIREGGGAGAQSQQRLGQRFGDPQTLRIMAEVTGGRAAYGTRDFEHALDVIASDLRSHYTLAFPPPQPSRDGRLKLEVRLKKRQRGIDLRHAERRRSRAADYRVADEAITALLLDSMTNHLDIGVRAEPARDIGKQWVVPLTVTIPIGLLSLLKDGDSRRGQISLFLTGGDLERGAGQVQKATVPLALTADTMTGDPEQRLEYPVDVPIDRGARFLAVTVRDDLRPINGTVRVVVMPPAP